MNFPIQFLRGFETKLLGLHSTVSKNAVDNIRVLVPNDLRLCTKYSLQMLRIAIHQLLPFKLMQRTRTVAVLYATLAVGTPHRRVLVKTHQLIFDGSIFIGSTTT